MKVELHVHTKYSKDSFMCFWPLLIKCRLKGIDSIAITDHNSLKGATQFAEFCLKHGNKLHVILGEEIFTNTGEIIGLYLKQEIPPGLSPKETIKLIKKQNGIVYVPHPYDKKRHRTVLHESAIQENKNFIDCIEIHNGRNISSQYDIEQRKIANKYQLTPVIGSDAHTLIEIGRNYLIMDNTELLTSNDFNKTIKGAQFHCENCLRVSHCISKFVRLLKLLIHGDFHELHRVIVRKIKGN